MSDRNEYIPMPSTAQNAALGFCFERKLPNLRRHTGVVVWDGGEFLEARTVRRVPGPCYWVEISVGPRRGQQVLMSCGNFGGVGNVE